MMLEKIEGYNKKYFDFENFFEYPERKSFEKKNPAFKTFFLNNDYIVGLFQGDRGQRPKLDFKIKYLKKGETQKLKTPTHDEWVMTLVCYIIFFPNEIKEMMEYYLTFYDNTERFKNKKERNEYLPITVEYIIKKFDYVKLKGNYLPIEIIAYLLEYFTYCEKNSNDNAFRFKELMLNVIRYIINEIDIHDLIGILKHPNYSLNKSSKKLESKVKIKNEKLF